MKKLLLIAFALLCISTVGAKEYKPMLTDGKLWKWVEENIMQGNHIYSIAVYGDTIVRGQTCKRIYFRPEDFNPSDVSSLSGDCLAAYEEDGCVYVDDILFQNQGKFVKMLDFNMQVGETLFGYIKVANEDYKEINGDRVRRIKFRNSYKDVSVWVEGIGPCNNYYSTPLPVPTNGYMGDRMLECYDNGKLIYTADDFLKGWDTNGIALPTAEKTAGGTTYDISGKPTNAPHKGEIYIKDGKKQVMR